MNSNDSKYIGIDPTSGNKDFGYAVLDSSLDLIKLDEANLDELVASLAEYKAVVVAVNAPAGVNQGLVKKKLSEEQTGPGRTMRGTDIRLVEFELRERGILVAGTPSREEFCPAWMQLGFNLYRQLDKVGYQPYDRDGSDFQVLETHPFACFVVLAESIPFPKPTLEGRLQRQLLLNDKGLRINDAMEFFEEITRFRLMKGILPQDVLYTAEQLDVLVAAYTAWLAANHPEEVTQVGNNAEGQMILPARELKRTY